MPKINSNLYKSRLESLALSLGIFDRVNLAEPVSAPSTGITCAIWRQSAGPARNRSGLQKTAMRVELNIRLFHVLRAENPDVVDDLMSDASSDLMEAISGDFDLGQENVFVDLLGAHGVPLSDEAGYAEQDDITYRIITITVPLIVDDVFDQVK